MELKSISDNLSQLVKLLKQYSTEISNAGYKIFQQWSSMLKQLDELILSTELYDPKLNNIYIQLDKLEILVDDVISISNLLLNPEVDRYIEMNYSRTYSENVDSLKKKIKILSISTKESFYNIDYKQLNILNETPFEGSLIVSSKIYFNKLLQLPDWKIKLKEIKRQLLNTNTDYQARTLELSNFNVIQSMLYVPKFSKLIRLESPKDESIQLLSRRHDQILHSDLQPLINKKQMVSNLFEGLSDTIVSRFKNLSIRSRITKHEDIKRQILTPAELLFKIDNDTFMTNYYLNQCPYFAGSNCQESVDLQTEDLLTKIKMLFKDQYEIFSNAKTENVKLNPKIIPLVLKYYREQIIADSSNNKLVSDNYLESYMFKAVREYTISELKNRELIALHYDSVHTLTNNLLVYIRRLKFKDDNEQSLMKALSAIILDPRIVFYDKTFTDYLINNKVIQF